MRADRLGSWAAAGVLTVVAAQGQPLQQVPESACAGQLRGASCWMELASPHGCYVWRRSLKRGESVTWTGSCPDGRADGTGTLRWVWKSTESRTNEVEGGGLLRGGKPEGRWIERFARGIVWEGMYVAGVRHGNWVERYPGGAVHEGPYVDGKRHGRWIERGPDPDAPSRTQIWGHGSLFGGNPR